MRVTLRPLLSLTAAALAVVGLQTASYAHFIWATIDNGQARFALLESIDESPNDKFASYVTSLSPHCGAKTLAIGAPKDGATYAALPSGLAANKGVVTATSTVGAKERNGENYLLLYHAKGAVSLAAAGEVTREAAEVTARQDGDNLVVSVRQEGWPVPESEVWVQWPGQTEPTSVTTDMSGDARVPYPGASARYGGFVGVRALVREVTSGTYQSKPYAAVHHWATLTFPVSGPRQQTLTQAMRAAYGDKHEVVSHAAFNETLFAGALTRAQVETHLQQRALVHNEIHRIVVNSKETNLPYGDAQKSVLVLLFTDLVNMGSGWPTEAQARPSTKAFLEQIRESEKQGPYFALGVNHVYYGGITNGGRMIGAKIGETIKFTPTYYEKSDGYTEYLTEVNKITDPHARAEMIRGGKAAYDYIIESMNEDVYKNGGTATARAL